MRKSNKAAWWQVYLVVIGAIALMWVQHRAGLAVRQRQFGLLAIVLVVHALIWWWVQANETGLDPVDLERHVRAQACADMVESAREESMQAQPRCEPSVARSDNAGSGHGPAPGLAFIPVRGYYLGG
jgi:hypothetical protein